MTPAIDTIYQGVMEFIHQATKSSNDDVVSMDTLGVDIGALTEAINALPLNERLKYQGKLSELSLALKELEAQLQTKKQVILDELESQPQQRKAHAAYQRTDKLEG